MIKLILSVLMPVMFISNYWICEYLYPESSKDWSVFIPMDTLAHNFWAVIMFGYAVIAGLKTKYEITHFFLYIGVCFSFFDITSRIFGMTDFNQLRYLFAFISSIIISGVFYGIRKIQ